MIIKFLIGSFYVWSNINMSVFNIQLDLKLYNDDIEKIKRIANR